MTEVQKMRYRLALYEYERVQSIFVRATNKTTERAALMLMDELVEEIQKYQELERKEMESESQD